LPRLVSNFDPPDLCLPSSWDKIADLKHNKRTRVLVHVIVKALWRKEYFRWIKIKGKTEI
jgi:hypothetical protein